MVDSRCEGKGFDAIVLVSEGMTDCSRPGSAVPFIIARSMWLVLSEAMSKATSRSGQS